MQMFIIYHPTAIHNSKYLHRLKALLAGLTWQVRHIGQTGMDLEHMISRWELSYNIVLKYTVAGSNSEATRMINIPYTPSWCSKPRPLYIAITEES